MFILMFKTACKCLLIVLKLWSHCTYCCEQKWIKRDFCFIFFHGTARTVHDHGTWKCWRTFCQISLPFLTSGAQRKNADICICLEWDLNSWSQCSDDQDSRFFIPLFVTSWFILLRPHFLPFIVFFSFVINSIS